MRRSIRVCVVGGMLDGEGGCFCLSAWVWEVDEGRADSNIAVTRVNVSSNSYDMFSKVL